MLQFDHTIFLFKKNHTYLILALDDVSKAFKRVKFDQ